ncbi:sigma-70 family RNA polymerase sigma factor [Actinomycetospora chlora]|uniref:Sigma-70 family RNA polymerase sigma factor n=2 Tax=Actinomycetospora chlora TaxID=663608 RepID=A0ABP9A5H5_9PSEU
MGMAGADARPDTELAVLAAGGDQVAFAELMTRHRPRLYAVCRRITTNDQDAQEALQETMIIAWKRLGEFDGRSAVGTWLYRVATNAAIDEVRRRKRAPEPAETVPEPTPARGADGGVVARMDVDRALAQLPPQYRAVVVLRELCDLSYAEIAEMRDIPIDTVKSQLSRGRRALVELLGDHPAARTA